jgi:tryptophan synthase alpha chain
VRLINAIVAAGVDIIEVGLPYSDPLMDGPAIQEAVDRALRAGTTTDVVLDTVAQVCQAGATAVVMTYWNPVERYGVERFAGRLQQAGGVGLITPDLTPEEAEPYVRATDEHGLSRIFLVAPSSTDERISTVAAASSGFVYAASTMGVTGVRAQVGSAAADLVRRTRQCTSLPIAVGLGVSTGEQAREVAAYADGVIVGSAFIRRVLDAAGPGEAESAVADLAADLARGVRG